MDNNEAKKLIKEVFNNIQTATCLDDITDIPKNNLIEDKYQMDTKKFPKLDLDITEDDINKLGNILTDKNYFKSDISSTIEDPIAKILYALAWKNGDIHKVHHIIDGIQGKERDGTTGITFHQFGKYCNNKNEPIIDQHVIRAYSAFKNITDESEFETTRKLKQLRKKHTDTIDEYKEWLNSLELSKRPGLESSYRYEIDKVLFAVGKTIKILK